MAKVYSLKESFTFEEFEELGYTVFPKENKIIKICEQPLNGEAVKSIMKQYYTNPEWKEKFYSNNMVYYAEELGLTYTKSGKPRMTKKFKEVLKSWLIQIDLNDDFWVGFTSYDWCDTCVFYGCSVLDKFCAEEIELLKEHNLIEEIEVSE
jgi:hypothetical protein